ncbi:unnamed protein product [Mytilus coruscus]|uniref:Ig-like domain-containing protein n=1 Tax=Mytilus coruscus TaxID=42192 RepID=A0A6J8AWG7_MYTCO|nr:unnamed protein product [Mytilus coruscus]
MDSIIPLITEKVIEMVKPKIIQIVDECMQPHLLSIKHNKDALILKDVELNKYKEEMKMLKTKLDKVEARIEEQEQYSRRTSLRFHNVPAPTDDNGDIIKPINTDALVLGICNKNLNLNLNTRDIGRSHPIGEIKDGKIIAIIVRFLSYRQRQLVFNSKRNLKGNKTKFSLQKISPNTETHLDSNITDDDISIMGFQVPVRKDRNSHGGGIIMYFKNYVHITRRQDLEHDEIENDANKDLPEFDDRCHDFLSQIIVSEQDVLDIVSTLDANKAVGPDIVSNRMLLAVRNEISKPLWLQLSSGQICMSTKIRNDRLQLVCKVNHLELEVYIRDPLGDQKTRCVIPNPKPECFTYDGDATQSLSSNMTVLTLNKNSTNNHRVNGEWSCLHGTYNERATAIVNIQGKKEADEVSVNVLIKGPTIVKKNQAFMSICFCTEVPENQTAEFHVENGVSHQIMEMERKCKTNLNHSTCSDNKSYELVYHAPKSSGILTVSCAMTIQPFGKLSDCIFVKVVDLTGPILSVDSNSPIFENMVLTFVCTAFSAENEVHLSWTCVNGTREDDTLVNSSTSTFISKLIYQVKIRDNGRICTCDAQIGAFTSADTMTLHVTEDFPKNARTGAIYFAAPQEENRANLYDDISHYDEIEN